MRSLTVEGVQSSPHRELIEEWCSNELAEFWPYITRIDHQPPSRLVLVEALRLRDGKPYVDTDGNVARRRSLRHVSTPVPVQ